MRKKPEEILPYLSEIYGDDRDWKSTLDPDVVDLIELLNGMSGIITIGSCSGHGLSGATGEQHKKGDKPYLYFVCRDLSSQYIVLTAFREVKGDQEYQFEHPKIVRKTDKQPFPAIEGPLLSLRFKEYQDIVLFYENLKHEIKELEWKKQNRSGRARVRKPSGKEAE